MAALLLAASAILPFSPQTASFFVAAYWLVLLLFCAWLIWLDRNTDNFALLMLLAAFTIFQTAYAVSGDLSLLRAQVHLNMAAVMFVSVRVSVLLGAEALKKCRLKDPVFIPNVVYKNIAITFLLLLHAAAELWLPAQTAGFTALAVGFILLAKLRELHHHELLRKHYVRTYYLLQLFAAAGYLWTGAAKLQNLPASAPLHLITLGGMMGSVMMGLWHSGFTKLDYPKLCRIAVPILFAAAVSRAVLMNVNPIFFITVPAILTAAVFVLYLLTFVPIFRANAFTDDPE
ncbi:NnrS protein [Neisseria meningitidis]|nr:NnrS protein [Neisseria meningitidis]EJU77326.1 putative integral membrane protein [Neisseria meningitidis NM2795]